MGEAKNIYFTCLKGIFLYLLVAISQDAMAEKPQDEHVPEEEEGYVKGLTAEEIMNLPAMPDDEDDETRDMTIDEIIERANQGCRQGPEECHEEEGGPYIVQGDIAMTKEQYEEHMADWKKQEAELIAKGEIKPPK